MTADDFRREALSLPGVEERSHMGHPDFRVKEKVFASLGYPDAAWGMVKLTPEDQRMFVQSHPEAFALAQGAWGVQGSTLIKLKAADPEAVREALKLACLSRTKPVKKSKAR
jgi:hypothetical protein